MKKFNAVLRLDGRVRDDFETNWSNGSIITILCDDDLANAIKDATAWVKKNWVRFVSCGAWEDDGYCSEGIETICSGCAGEWGF